ncbi:MAG: DUF72 domain-containing protein [Coriobacteriia bacterium]|nr:DUF72 domain-containing protein [Coriobacteriia bacterium]
MGELLIGTSGFVYPHWKGVFYPEGLSEARWLPYYAERFRTVELNVTYYNLPERETFGKWRRSVPEGFAFVVKGSRYITHMKRLKDARAPVRELMSRASALGETLSCVLWQLPARSRANLERLQSFCDVLSAEADGVRHAFEFRHESWFNDEVLQTLRRHGHALVVAHSTRWPGSREVTAGFTYLRFHGGAIEADSAYAEEELREWAAVARDRLGEGLDVYAFFNNDAHGYAVRDAKRFRVLAGTRD